MERRRMMMDKLVIPTTDLSMVDNAGNARQSMTTANCYLVHRAGTYVIPLVYGNAIKNGAANTIAYAPGGTASTTYCTNFINHNGDAITGPWITKNGSGVNAGMGISVTSAELLWQDVQGLISSVSIDGDYLKFTVGTFNGGNALIAVKSGSTIVWSWHIWATTETLTTTTSIATGSRTYNVAPVYLGWVPTSDNGKQGYCTFYQWGRKDAFIPTTGSANTAHTVYNINNSSVTGITYRSYKNAYTIADNIKNPTTHYNDTSVYGPCKTGYYNMWDAQNTATSTDVSTATKKTIYDPCPPDFCVPTNKLYNYIYNNKAYFTWDSTNKGRLWTKDSPNIWFCAVGQGNYNSDEGFSYVGTRAYVWAAIPYNNKISWYMWFADGSSVGWSYQYRAYRYAVRPVAEE